MVVLFTIKMNSVPGWYAHTRADYPNKIQRQFWASVIIAGKAKCYPACLCIEAISVQGAIVRYTEIEVTYTKLAFIRLN